jgi:aryl-alcohol dehydrogenase-like predicted oxidoreductase
MPTKSVPGLSYGVEARHIVSTGDYPPGTRADHLDRYDHESLEYSRATTGTGAMQGTELIVLGTVQLGPGYGRRAGRPPMAERAAVSVLDKAWELGIRAFDTAESYGCARERLATWITSKDRIQACDITTKIATRGGIDLSDVRRVCAPFSQAKKLTLLAHDAVDEDAFTTLRSAAGILGAACGLSVYTSDEVKQAVKLGACRVQGPASVIDQRQLAMAHLWRIPFDARSVFLQGILLDDAGTAERRVSGLGAVAVAVASAAREVGLQPAAALLASLLGKLAPGDRVVLGFEKPEQLDFIPDALVTGRAVIDAFDGEFHRSCPAISSLALDPRTW